MPCGVRGPWVSQLQREHLIQGNHRDQHLRVLQQYITAKGRCHKRNAGSASYVV